MTERWRWIENYKGYYQVSDMGRVRSVDRIVPCTNAKCGSRRLKGRVLEPRLMKNPEKGKWRYPRVGLLKNSAAKDFLVHVLVMRAFKGPPPPGMEVCHRDGNYNNPSLFNLRYGTHSSNHMDRHDHGTMAVGVEVHGAKLTEAKVRKIRRLARRGCDRKTLSEQFGVCRGTIRQVVLGLTWTHV